MKKERKKERKTYISKEAIENVNGFRVRREAKHIMEAKTVFTPLISPVGDKILVSIFHI